MRNIQHQAPPVAMPSQRWGIADLNWVRPGLETDVTRQMSCEVVFGSPSANCMGTGICRITARTAQSVQALHSKKQCQNTIALLFPIEGGQGFSMVLNRSMLCTQLYKTHLRHGQLRLEAPYVLPKRVIQTLKLSTMTIAMGQYDIRESAGFLRIDFWHGQHLNC